MSKDQLEPYLDQLLAISGRYCRREGGSHGPDHSERVFHSAMAMGRALEARLLILGTAALLHDIGRNAESRSRGAVCHARQGAVLARPILEELGYQPTDIEAVCHCIESHRFRRGSPPQSLEARILFDADKLDSIGAIGIGRAFLFAGQIGACLHNPETNPEQTSPYSAEDTAYREFQVKMSRVKDQLLTGLGRQLALERHAFMETFFSQLNQEIYGVEASIAECMRKKHA
ncbi:HD domain-containing protein [Desulfogranum mediterraneum]|uniref:HD domain-containing protein n=1 Tax=Desulfogranum mediterraneum TaxID=160661 RepID=UPI000419F7C0|nr:HD domain-containing protein [Desulfogranum mediterraneum]